MIQNEFILNCSKKFDSVKYILQIYDDVYILEGYIYIERLYKLNDIIYIR